MRLPYDISLKTDDGLSFVNDIECEIEVTPDFINGAVSIRHVWFKVYDGLRFVEERDLLDPEAGTTANHVAMLVVAKAEADLDLISSIRSRAEIRSAHDARRINALIQAGAR